MTYHSCPRQIHRHSHLSRHILGSLYWCKHCFYIYMWGQCSLCQLHQTLQREEGRIRLQIWLTIPLGMAHILLFILHLVIWYNWLFCNLYRKNISYLSHSRAHLTHPHSYLFRHSDSSRKHIYRSYMWFVQLYTHLKKKRNMYEWTNSLSLFM